MAEIPPPALVDSAADAEQALRRANKFLDSIIENIPDMVFVKEATNLTFVRFNRAGEELLGWDRSTLLGRSDYDFFPREEADFFVAKDREVLASGQLKIIEEEPIETHHGRRYLHTRKIPICDDGGRPLYLLGISRDITAARKAAIDHAELTRRLEERNDELVRASRAKSDFLAMMSHELRTPLNSIIGFSEVLVDGKFGALNDKQGRYLGNVRESGKHLLRLINQLLDLSKVEAGRLEVRCEPCPVREVIDAVVATMRPLLDERRVVVALDSVAAQKVVVDPMRFRQVLYNLLSNAIKFSPDGGTIRIACTPAPPAHLRITIADRGPGISADDLARLFQPFTQLPGGRDRGGTGLGLVLTRQLVELMDGTVGVTSTPGAGATFHVDLRLAPA